MDRGTLRVYLGAAPAVGTTCAMLAEGCRRRARGATVLVGAVETHGRQGTRAAVAELIGMPRDRVELDVAAVLAAEPDVVLVDDLAHENPAGSERRHRWDDVEVILRNGVDVLATLSVGHIAALAEPPGAEPPGAARRAPPGDTVPDAVLGRIDQIEVVDISPEALRRRIAHGNAFSSEELDHAGAELFDVRAFARRRALMMAWMADRLASTGDGERRGREPVLVAITDSPDAPALLRRAALLAERAHAPLVAVHVAQPDEGAAERDERRRRVEAAGAAYREVVGADVAGTLLSFAASSRATQLVIGSGAGGAPWRARRRTIVDEILRRDPPVDVHVVPTGGRPERGRAPSTLGRVPRRRQVGASVVGAAALGGLTLALTAMRGDVSVSSSLALYLLVVVAITAVGGAVPGLCAAVTAPLLANWFLIPPYHTLRVGDGENVLELLVFVSVAAIVSAYVSIAARRAAETERARREASTLATLSGFGSLEMPEALVEHLRRTFRFDGVAVLTGLGGEATAVASSGSAPSTAAEADLVTSLDSGLVIAARGRALTADDHRLLEAFAAQLARAFEQQRLRVAAAEAEALARADELRTAMLRAVSHDLRSPLASIKASVSSLLQRDIEWAPAARDEFLTSIESETDRLTSIVTNLLDLSRLEAGVLRPVHRATSLEEVVAAALHGLGERHPQVRVDLPSELPEVRADPALLERAVANLVSNATAWTPPDAEVRIAAVVRDERVHLLVIDHGPGIPPAKRDVVVQPFHRLGDAGGGSGLGLGLAIADRFIAAMSGALELEDTPGGGLTAVVSLPLWGGGER